MGRGVPPSRPPSRHRNFADFCYTVHTQEITMGAAENQIVVYQPNETVRLDMRVENELKQKVDFLVQIKKPPSTPRLRRSGCENVASSQFQFPIEEAA